MQKQLKHMLEDLNDQIDEIETQREYWCEWFEDCQDNMVSVFDEILDLQNQVILLLENPPDDGDDGFPRPDPLPISFSKYKKERQLNKSISDPQFIDDTDLSLPFDL